MCGIFRVLAQQHLSSIAGFGVMPLIFNIKMKKQLQLAIKLSYSDNYIIGYYVFRKTMDKT
jgi:hypothetical protein